MGLRDFWKAQLTRYLIARIILMCFLTATVLTLVELLVKYNARTEANPLIDALAIGNLSSPLLIEMSKSAVWIGLANLQQTFCVGAFMLWLVERKLISRIASFAAKVSSQNLENPGPWLQNYRNNTAAHAKQRKPSDEITVLETAFEKNTEHIIKLFKEKDEALRRSESANSAKKQFLSAMSHEMRTPLSSIINGSLLIQEQTDVPKIKELSQIIVNSGESLLEFFNRILDFLSVSESDVPLESDTIHAEEFMHELERKFAPLAEKKHVSLEFKKCAAPSYSFKADRFRLMQIVEVLLENALQFTDEGEVRINLQPSERTLNQSKICIEVTDSGPGVDPRSAETVFQPFAQLCDSLGHPNKSLGLGLSVAQLLVSKMGGRIWHGARPDGRQGAVFGFEIPCQDFVKASPNAARAARAAVQKTAAVKKLAVLIVEDDLFTQHIMELMLRQLGVAKVTLASNGRQALESLRIHKADLAFIDVQMPELNGIETSALIASDFKTNERPLIVLMSAMMSDELGNLAKGLDLFKIESKPLRPARLASIVNTAAAALQAIPA